MRELPALYALYSERKAAASAKHGRWREIAQVFDGELVIPHIETDDVAVAAVPNLISQGINFYARTFASTQPDVDCPAVRPGITRSRKLAQDRTRAIKGWWQGSALALADYQRARYFFGYGAMPAVLRPHPDQAGVPRWEIRNPHGVLPGPKPVEYLPGVPDAFAPVLRSVRWIEGNYGISFGPKVHPDQMCEVVEYIDAEQVSTFCVGPAGPQTPEWTNGSDPSWFGAWGYEGWNYGSEIRDRRITHLGTTGPAYGNWLVMLSSTPNFAGTCTVSYPGAISLSKVAGLVDGILAKHKLQAQVMSLWMKAIAKGIFPNEWIELDANNGGTLVTMANGMKDQVGEIHNGRVVLNQINPGYQTGPFIDRLESYQRGEAGISPEFGGESGQNIRTGRRGEQVQATTVDPVVEEAHTIAEIAREHEIKLGVKIAKGYGGSRPISFYVQDSRRRSTLLTYQANDIFETDEAMVRYAVKGADVSGLIIQAGQSIGTGMMSLHDARLLNPLVEDVEATEIAIRTERAEQALFTALDTLAGTNPDAAARIAELTRKGQLPEEIWKTVQREEQERQASIGELGEPDGPVLPGDPAAQPGIGVPGEGGGQAPVIPEAPASLRNLAFLSANLRGPTRTVPAERTA